MPEGALHVCLSQHVQLLRSGRCGRGALTNLLQSGRHRHVGKKNVVITGLKKVRKCALNREWRSSDVFKVKRREGDRFSEVL